MDAATFGMEDVASQTAGGTESDPTFDEFDLGDSITFRVTLDLPKVAVDDKVDLI